ncbi:MAG: PorV/PorQ family protein [Gemmatimonadaceae bacterium]
MATAVALLAALPVRAASQGGGLATEGAPFLLIPVGARALGQGQAVVAYQGGSEAVWWNPAGLARAEKREAAVHHYQSFVGTGDAVSLLFPSSRLGVVTGSLYILNYGEDQLTDANGFPLGTVTPRNLVYAATYSTTVGARFNAGVTFKVVQFRIDCTGSCGGLDVSASTSAIDLGAQYQAEGIAPVTLGVAVRHLGLRLQVKDNDQADPLPTRLQVGAQYRVTVIERYARDTELHVSGDVIGALDLEAPAARVGADIAWRKRVHLRGGYAFDDSQAAGPSVGIGLAVGSLFVDVARLFEGFSESAGEAPSYVSLRYLF